MAVIHTVFVQQSPAPSARQAAPGTEEFRRQIQQTVREAQQAARDARAAARDAGQDVHGVVVGDLAPPALPGHSVEFGGFDNSNLIPPQAVDISISFFVMCAVMVVGWPIARAFGRRIERRGEVTTTVAPALTDQLQRIEQAVDAMSIEIERISESQRFMAKLQSTGGAERMALPHERG